MSPSTHWPAPDALVIECGLELRQTDGRTALLEAALEYSAEDPFAISARVQVGAEAVVWVFGRELLAEGLITDAGVGDVRIRPAVHTGRRSVVLTLSSPDGEADLIGSAEVFTEFLHRTYDLVPPETEWQHTDIDGLIAALLAPQEPSR